MRNIRTLTLLIAVAVAAGSCGITIPLIQSARNRGMEMSCANNMKQIALALMNYDAAYRQLPIAIETANNGKPWRSWRSRLYPRFIEQSQQVYDESAAWDSTSNTRLINGTPIPMAVSKSGGISLVKLPRVPHCFSCPKCDRPTGTNYVLITGKGTLFPDSRSVKLSEIPDGPENTLLIVESVTCTPDWIEPRDLDFGTMEFSINSRRGPSISSLHPGGALVCFADLEVFFLTQAVTEPELRALITVDGGEKIRRADLVSQGVLIER